ncbi:MAG: hypothetical protein HY909_08870 [Deltaproteobacteria bacterium]|nr:hypothetical protein [Deltaproteobacteria bacterium]
MRTGIALAALVALSPAARGSNPTVWVLDNRSPGILFVACRASGGEAGAARAEFRQLVPARGTYRHTWGLRVSDASLGLRPGRWRCAASRAADPLADRRAQALVFDTGWGEDLHVRIFLDRGRVTLQRL